MPLPTPRDRSAVAWRASLPFLLAQAAPLLVIFTGITAKAVVLGVVLYWLRVFGITAGYHRYFSHRAYSTSRAFQFLLAFLGAGAAQKGVLWWAANHRKHHRYADTERDPHSPQKGFWWSHIGWVLSSEFNETDYADIPDFARYPELRFIDRHDWIAPWTFGIASYLIAGWSGLVVGFFASTLVLWHSTFMVNSVAHIWGWRRFGTADSSRNNPLVAFLTMGEGWHNNHHHHPACARQGFRWWEIDASYYVLRFLSWFGVVRDLKQPAPSAMSARRVRDGFLDVGRIRQHLSRALARVPAHDDELHEAFSALEAASKRRDRAPDPPERTPVEVA